MDRSIQIIGGKFANTEMIPFSTTLAVQPSRLYKGSGERRKMPASIICKKHSVWIIGAYSLLGLALCQ